MTPPDHAPPSDGQASPHRHLSLLDSTSIIVGIVIGSTIYCSTPLIARLVPNVTWLLGVWIIGAVFTLIGALCYAELATAFPQAGGDYVFLTEAFGRKVGFHFAWSQFWIVRPASIGVLAFIYAQYADKIFPLPERFCPLLVHAAGSVILLSVINLLGIRAGKTTQNVLTLAKLLGLVAIVIAGLCFSATAPGTASSSKPPEPNLGLAMIFVFLAYSGWNEMAYVGSEVRDPQKNILRALVLGTLAVAVVYLAVTLAFIHALGLGGVRQSEAVAADVLSLSIGPLAGKLISILICITALGGINGMVFTGARIFYAVGKDHRLFAWLGRWNSLTDAPARPLVIQCLASVAIIVGFGWNQQGSDGFNSAVAFTSPTFYLYLLLVGASLFVLRGRGQLARAYHVPLYPLLPLLFCVFCTYMLYNGFEYALKETPWGLAASIAVLAVGAVLAIWVDNREATG